jgi:hypothetical protein
LKSKNGEFYSNNGKTGIKIYGSLRIFLFTLPHKVFYYCVNESCCKGFATACTSHGLTVGLSVVIGAIFGVKFIFGLGRSKFVICTYPLT